MNQQFNAFRLCDRLVEPSLNRVTATTGEAVQVEPKIMEVLAALAARPGEVVTRDELMAQAWAGVFVTDDALHRAIREIRRLFDDDAERPRVVETIRKRGYRLIAPVSNASELIETQPATPPAVQRGFLVATVIGVAALAGIAAIWLGVARPSVDTEGRVRFVPLTSEPGNEIDPALSSTGRLAYVARADDGRAHIFTKTQSDGTATQVTRGDGAERAPVWSPDESRLAFVEQDASGCAIRIAAADGREARTLIPCTSTEEFRMSWSPDGRFLALTVGAMTMQSPSHIDVIDVEGSVRRSVTSPPPAHAGDWSPAFSPDGRSIAFVRNIGGSIADIFVSPLDGGQPRRVTTDNADVLGVDWEPDGRHLVFSSDRAGGIGVWRVSVDGGEPTLLAGGGAKLKHPSVARSTGMVAYEDWQYEINLREQSTDAHQSATGVPVSPTGDRWNFFPQISPDGRRLVFESTRSGHYELWMSDRDGSNARPLTRSAVYKSPARWSHDGRRLAFTSRTEGHTVISLLDVDTDAIRTLGVDQTSAVAPAWSADDRSIYVGSLRSGAWQIWKLAVDTGDAQQVTTDGGYAALASPDGRWLYVSRLDRRGLWRRPVDGGAETLVSEHAQAEQWPNWGLLANGIYYVSWPDDDDPCVTVLDNGSNAPRVLARMKDYAWTGIALTPDASRVIFAHADRRAANIGGLSVSR
ncbi:MAG TPA: winged helix-turn-helix domain-containing protein [Vicinamibacterales bacterium]|jgi:Tol biopolymer transport system component/DNA-binding winged helix-turn-helix (wHTH) protein